MKIIVTSQSDDINSKVDPRFGRAQYFILYDTDSDSWSVLDNIQSLNAMQGAGIQAAENVANADAGYVLTGHCGPKAFRVLAANGIKIITGVEGIVADAIEQFKKGELKETKQADVKGHWE